MVTIEHYHDVGKMMFAFTIFWAYIAFSQFMLIWYANIPEETAWFKQRFANDWKLVSAALLFGQFVIPFFGLMSRQVKRNPKLLAFWAVWVLVINYVDMYWLIMPQLDPQNPPVSLLDVTCWLGIAGRLRGRSGVQCQEREPGAHQGPAAPQEFGVREYLSDRISHGHDSRQSEHRRAGHDRRRRRDLDGGDQRWR